MESLESSSQTESLQRNHQAQIIKELQKLLAAGFIGPIEHPKWLSNIVPVKKKNGQMRYCVDFRNLNKACPKDEFPLPNMDMLIDSARHAIFSFMDGFSGYNQIRMSPKDANGSGYYRLAIADGEVLAEPVNGKWLKLYYA